jgi:DnaJ-class molecular chaperone
MTTLCPTHGPEQAPLSVPSAADCGNCGGSGKVWLESDGGGPWKGKQLVDCPICNGSGKA